jgi:catechol 2,3-dioxygenase-like lactoylglutathione lyase family enzyme
VRIRLSLAFGLLFPFVGFAGVSVDSIGITVSDLDQAVAFYRDVLSFEKVSEQERSGEEWERLSGVFGMRVRTARLRLGNEAIELTEYLTPKGRALPADSKSNDRWFQHIAIIVSDMDQAYKRLRAHKVQHVSTGPQRLPDWNPGAAGIQAFYFKDPDGHALEILSFPPGKGESRWQRKDALFLGIDHTAIVVADTEASLRFYRDTLGMKISGWSENYGPEQERLNSVFGARLRITALRGTSGPGIEFLEYLAPQGGRPYPSDAQPNDLSHWRTRLTTDALADQEPLLTKTRTPRVSAGAVAISGAPFRKAIEVRDPDGHALQLVMP